MECNEQGLISWHWLIYGVEGAELVKTTLGVLCLWAMVVASHPHMRLLYVILGGASSETMSHFQQSELSHHHWWGLWTG